VLLSVIPSTHGPGRTLVGDGAAALGTDVERVSPSSQITTRAHESWKKWSERLENADTNITVTEDIHGIQDTVGAVVSSHDGMSAGVSRYAKTTCGAFRADRP